MIQNDFTTGYVFERAGYRLHYWLAGPAGGPLVALTHGAGMDHRMFATQVAALAPDYRVLTWDVRGHGQSHPFDPAFSIPGAAEDLVALLDHLGCERAALVGHSMGGYIGQELVFRAPERVVALAAIGCTCLTLPHPALVQLGMRLSPFFVGCSPHQISTWLAAWMITSTPATRAYVEEVLGRHSEREFVTIWSAVMRCVHPEPGYRIEQPLLLTHGEHDNLGLGAIKQQAAAWAARDPNCRYVIIPNAAHNPHQENPDFFNPLLLQFLREHVPAPARK